MQHPRYFKDPDFRARMEQANAEIRYGTAEEFFDQTMAHRSHPGIQQLIDWAAARRKTASE